ncbi:unnamed protein product [Trypanosoma congolense IL3000]|uniref:WGS project CAEQ00000000 data, annotated contig 2203 n=1 Tax=Trypanosoma congolense (strain IL3000) TaxID=1068625 RepID=F9WCA0_TRYCI|nr:unnamed protein product [Trypanosoma congolense IL3000]
MRRVRAAAALTGFCRCFDSTTRFGKELGFSHKMRDIPVLTGNPRPVAREEEWSCRYKLTDRMEDVVRDVLQKAGWNELELKREMDEIFERKTHGSRSSLNTWTTVEEFQRTPWYRRYKPTDTCVAKYISYEVIKALEEALIPPSLRGDPYAHLRRRHMEDNWMNDRFSEETAKYIRREDLSKHTKGLPEYGQVTRRKFLEFDRMFKEAHGARQHVNEAYSAWLQSIGKK